VSGVEEHQRQREKPCGGRLCPLSRAGSCPQGRARSARSGAQQQGLCQTAQLRGAPTAARGTQCGTRLGTPPSQGAPPAAASRQIKCFLSKYTLQTTCKDISETSNTWEVLTSTRKVSTWGAPFCLGVACFPISFTRRRENGWSKEKASAFKAAFQVYPFDL